MLLERGGVDLSGLGQGVAGCRDQGHRQRGQRLADEAAAPGTSMWMSGTVTGGTGGTTGSFTWLTLGVIDSVMVQVNGGSFCSRFTTINSSTANRMKRFQLMLASQVP